MVRLSLPWVGLRGGKGRLLAWMLVLASSGLSCRDRPTDRTPSAGVEETRVDRRLGALAGPVHGAWVVRFDLATPQSVERCVEQARRARLDTLLVQVRGRGDAWYSSRLVPRARELAARPEFDPLREILRLAHRHGIRVHAWMNVGVIAAASGSLPDDHLAEARTDWLSRPISLPSDAPVSALRAFAASHPESVEGLYAEPAHSGYQDHFAAVVDELLTTYAVDGVHLDYIRHPRPDFGLCPETVATLRRRVGARELGESELVRSHRTEFDALLRAGITEMVRRVRATVDRFGPEVQLTTAVLPERLPAHALHQDWRTWVTEGLVDAICPMNYAEDRASFDRLATAVARDVPRDRVWMGLGSWRLSSDEIRSRVSAQQAESVGGVVHFSLGGLRGQHRMDAFDGAPTGRERSGISENDEGSKDSLRSPSRRPR